MRRATALAMMTLMATTAHAADYLRGPLPEPAMRAPAPQAYDWSGFTIAVLGAHGTGKVDQSTLSTDVANATFPDLGGTSLIAGLVNYGRPTLRGNGFSVAFGYNTMWDDVVVGAEAEYTQLSGVATSAFGPIGRDLYSSTSTSTSWDTNVSGTARTRVRDYTVGRFRVGTAFDRFLPYATLGIAVGRTSSSAQLTGTTQQYYHDLDPTTSLPRATAVSGVIPGNGMTKTSAMTWGYALGAGIDVAITDGIFLRGQYEYLGFGGSKNASLGMNTFKGGIGAKF